MKSDFDTLVKKVKTDNQNDIPFTTTKQTLLQDGYSLEDIALAASHVPYDHEKRSQNSVQPRYNSATREAADKHAQDILLEAEHLRQRQGTRDIGLSMIRRPVSSPWRLDSINTQSFITASGYLGFPVIKIVFIGISTTVTLFTLNKIGLIGVGIIINFISNYIMVLVGYIGVILFYNASKSHQHTNKINSNFNHNGSRKVMTILIIIAVVAATSFL